MSSDRQDCRIQVNKQETLGAKRQTLTRNVSKQPTFDILWTQFCLHGTLLFTSVVVSNDSQMTCARRRVRPAAGHVGDLNHATSRPLQQHLTTIYYSQLCTPHPHRPSVHCYTAMKCYSNKYSLFSSDIQHAVRDNVNWYTLRHRSDKKQIRKLICVLTSLCPFSDVKLSNYSYAHQFVRRQNQQRNDCVIQNTTQPA